MTFGLVFYLQGQRTGHRISVPKLRQHTYRNDLKRQLNPTMTFNLTLKAKRQAKGRGRGGCPGRLAIV